jgi:hypothetical protein
MMEECPYVRKEAGSLSNVKTSNLENMFKRKSCCNAVSPVLESGGI